MFLGILLVVCALNLVWPDREFSESENRMLEQRPELSLSGVESGRYMEQYETYQADQIAGRDLWVQLKTHADLLMGKRESGGVFKGKDGDLLEDIRRLTRSRWRIIFQLSGNFRSLIRTSPCI